MTLRRTFFLSALLFVVSVNVRANSEGQGMPPNERKQALDRFIAKKKFVKEPFYVVDLHETDRLQYEGWVNQLALSLLGLAPSRQTKPVVLRMFTPVMKQFETAEGEEQERFLGYLDELMEIFGIESSDGLLSKWRHGHDTTAETKARVQTLNAQALAAMTSDERVLLERLQDLTRANAKETLHSLFGSPVVEADGGKMWSATTSGGESTLGLLERWGSITLIWRFRGLIYSRRL